MTIPLVQLDAYLEHWGHCSQDDDFVFPSFSRLFDRRTFSSKDGFTGQCPGIGHDASHLYAGGSRMCRGEGQVQAGLLKKGLEVCCSGGAGDFSEDLTDGRGIAFEDVAAR